jgi:TRAP-type C4-dicarboxylate transport system permease small subunit
MFGRKVDVLADFFYRIAYWASATMIVIIFLTTLLQVFCRYVLGRSLSWTEETSLIFFPWVVFLGASMVLKERGHVAIMFVVALFPVRLRHIMRVFIDAMIAFFAGYLLVFGWKLSVFVGAHQATTFWNVPYFYLYLSVCAGGVLLLIQGMLLLARDTADLFGWDEK